jgi:hypothetical protein
MREPRNQVVQLRGFGGPEELEVDDAPLPTAGRDEVRVRVLASSLEYTDVVIRRHLYPQTMRRRPPAAEAESEKTGRRLPPVRERHGNGALPRRRQR